MATPWVVVSDFLLLLAIAGKLGSECYALTSFMAFTETSVTSVRRDLRYLETRPGLLPTGGRGAAARRERRRRIQEGHPVMAHQLAHLRLRAYPGKGFIVLARDHDRS